MARLGGRSSESLSIPAAGLAGILRDHNARSNVLLGTLALQPPSIASSPESSVSEADIGEDDPDELKEEDVWAAETRLLQPDLSKPSKYGEASSFLYAESSFGPGFSKQKPRATVKSLGLGLGFGKADGDSALGLGSKAKKRENGAMGEFVSGLGRQKTNAGEVMRSSSRRRERGPVVADTFANGGLSRHTRPLESSPSSHVKSPSRRSAASWMIPQLGGVSKHSSRRHAERQSAPVQVPDWSKIVVKHKGKPGAAKDDSEEGDKDDDEDRLPPHELLAREYARSQRTTFSVCEGQGRTLKGRDLSRVRDAVWSQMGFAD